MKKNLKNSLSLIFFLAHLFIAPTLRASDVHLIIPEHITPLSMGSYLEYVIDTNNAINIQNIPYIKELSRSDRDIPNYNAGTNPIWYKCTLINHSENDVFLINVANPSLDYIAFYYPTTNGQWDSTVYGNNLPFNVRKYDEANYLFDIRIPQQDTVVVFFKLVSSDISRFPASIGKTEAIFSV